MVDGQHLAAAGRDTEAPGLADEENWQEAGPEEGGGTRARGLIAAAGTLAAATAAAVWAWRRAHRPSRGARLRAGGRRAAGRARDRALAAGHRAAGMVRRSGR